MQHIIISFHFFCMTWSNQVTANVYFIYWLTGKWIFFYVTFTSLNSFHYNTKQKNYFNLDICSAVTFIAPINAPLIALSSNTCSPCIVVPPGEHTPYLICKSIKAPLTMTYIHAYVNTTLYILVCRCHQERMSSDHHALLVPYTYIHV